jgi:hypothetical protein
VLKTKLVLILASVILIASLAVNTYFIAQLYSLITDNSSVQKEVDDFRSRVADLQSEKASLQDQLQKQQSTANPPELATRLGVKDIRASPYANHPWSGRIRFYVSGEVWNVGKVPAYNCTLHVVLFQGATVANDTYVPLGTIKAGSFADVAANVYYEGAALTSWNVTPMIG